MRRLGPLSRSISLVPGHVWSTVADVVTVVDVDVEVEVQSVETEAASSAAAALVLTFDCAVDRETEDEDKWSLCIALELVAFLLFLPLLPLPLPLQTPLTQSPFSPPLPLNIIPFCRGVFIDVNVTFRENFTSLVEKSFKWNFGSLEFLWFFNISSVVLVVLLNVNEFSTSVVDGKILDGDDDVLRFWVEP